MEVMCSNMFTQAARFDSTSTRAMERTSSLSPTVMYTKYILGLFMPVFNIVDIVKSRPMVNLCGHTHRAASQMV